MAAPYYRIYYGKYPDQLTGEIPTAHIRRAEGLRFRIEPGKPAEPKVDATSFTLENLNADGTERYDEAWFNSQSRSQAEGGLFPNQLFFSVELDTGAKFVGVLKSKSYGKWRQTVTVQVKSLFGLVSDKKLSILKPFQIENVEFNSRNVCDNSPPTGYQNDYPCPLDLDGYDLSQEQTLWIVEQQVSDSDYPALEHTDLLEHFFGTSTVPDPSGSSTSEFLVTGNINAFIKIGDNTILTTFNLTASKQLFQGQYQSLITLDIYQAKNGNVQLPDRLILERGRFFADSKGNDFTQFEKYTVTLLEPDRGYDPDIMLKQADMPSVQFMFGCPVASEGGRLQVQESALGDDVFDLVSLTITTIQNGLYGQYYYNPPNNTDLANLNSPAVYAFWADVGMFGWIDQGPGDVLVNMAMLAGCYVFVSEAGDIVYQDRLLHADALPASLPSGAFEVDLADIRPLGSQDAGDGFDSYTIEYNDRVEINNIATDASKNLAVDESGIRPEPALRNTDLQVHAYRTQNLGVPASQNGLPLFRRSPEDAGFAVSTLDLDDFLLTAPQQAQNFAGSWTYPVSLWKIQWDMPSYPNAGIGGYFWVDWGSEKRVYFIRDITHDGATMTHKMEVQQVGVWNG